MPLLILIFIVVPILELWVIIQVGQAIGALPTIALLILDSILGSWLLRRQGRQAWRAFNEALAAGRVPARETGDGALIMFGGALLLTPGFCTDVLGLLLLLPPTRAVFRRMLFRRGLTVGASAFGPAGVWTARSGQWAARGAGSRRSGPQPQYDVEGTATDVDARPDDRPALP